VVKPASEQKSLFLFSFWRDETDSEAVTSKQKVVVWMGDFLREDDPALEKLTEKRGNQKDVKKRAVVTIKWKDSRKRERVAEISTEA
jgi:hypothetical protein